MTDQRDAKDLMVIVADGDMESVIRSLLSRPQAIGIRSLSFDVKRHLQRDAGCRTDSHTYLRLWMNSFNYAMVVFDREGSGGEQMPREQLEATVESNLSRNGWRDRCAVVVIDPELESWVWSRSPHVDRLLGWDGHSPSLREWIQSETDYWHPDRTKPERPKEAMDAVLRRTKKRTSAALFADLASQVSVRNCSDPSFSKFQKALQNWFAVGEDLATRCLH